MYIFVTAYWIKLIFRFIYIRSWIIYAVDAIFWEASTKNYIELDTGFWLYIYCIVSMYMYSFFSLLFLCFNYQESDKHEKHMLFAGKWRSF